MSVLDNALEALGAGLNVHPPKEDGSKAPDALEWASRQNVMATESEVRHWYANGRTGLGLICGKVSRGLELFEFEGRAVETGVYNDFLRAAQAAALGDVVDRITAGYCESTPTGGVHLLSLCEETATTKLARRPATEAELAENPDDRFKVLIETKGEGGFVIVAPSSGTVHPTGKPWELMSGSFTTIATITPEERAELHRLARSFDRMPTPPPRPPRLPRAAASDGLRPGDDYNLRGDWHELLEAHGWRPRFTTRGGNEHWTRPGKETGTSATVSESGEGVLYVFSSSTPFEPDTAYDRFGAYAILEHGGATTGRPPSPSGRPATGSRSPRPTRGRTTARRPGRCPTTTAWRTTWPMAILVVMYTELVMMVNTELVMMVNTELVIHRLHGRSSPRAPSAAWPARWSPPSTPTPRLTPPPCWCHSWWASARPSTAGRTPGPTVPTIRPA